MMKITGIVFLGIMGLLVSCGNNPDYDESERESEVDDIIKGLAEFPDESYSFNPKDTGIEFPNDVKIFMRKEGFLNKDSTIYTGKVRLYYGFSSDPSTLFAQSIRRKNPETALKSVLSINATDEYGNQLLVNNASPPIISFHPKLDLYSSSYYYYDSVSKSYSAPLLFYKNIRKIISYQKDDTSFIGLLTDTKFIDTLSKNEVRSIRHNGSMITRQELVGYEMTIKHFGNYFISYEDKSMQLQPCSIQINAKIENDQEIPWHKVKLFLYTQQSKYNYFLTAGNISGSLFEVMPPPYGQGLSLPLENKYTIMAYAIDGDKSFFYNRKNIKLQRTNTFQIELKEIEFSGLLTEIKKL